MSNPDQSGETAATKLSVFLEWCEHHRIWIDPRIELRHDESAGVGVFAVTSLDTASTVAVIPKDCIFSLKSCPKNVLLEKFLATEKHGPTLLLTLALSFEILAGPSSPWWGYLQSLPKHVDLPTFWGIESNTNADSLHAFEWLQGTELLKHVYVDQMVTVPAILDLYERVIESTDKDHGSQFLTQHLIYAFSLISSRAFQVDDYHGIAMVPIADAFNHVEENTVHLETDYFVCPQCGSLDECIHDDPDRPRVETLHSLPHSRPQEANTCDMVTNAVILPGDELYNSYNSTLSNAQLMMHYGFMLEGNSNDTIDWTSAEVDQLLNFIEVDDEVKAARLALWTSLANESLPLEDTNADELIYDPRDLPASYHSGGEDDDLDMGTIPEAGPALSRRSHTSLARKPTSRLSDPTNLLRIGAYGQISQQLWLYFVIHRVPHDALIRQTAQELVQSLAAPLLKIYTTEEGTRPTLNLGWSPQPIALAVADDIAALCQQRLKSMHMNHLSTQEIGDLLENISASETPRTRLSCTFALNERMILETCLGQWEDIRDRLRGLDSE